MYSRISWRSVYRRRRRSLIPSSEADRSRTDSASTAAIFGKCSIVVIRSHSSRNEGWSGPYVSSSDESRRERIRG